MPENRWAITCKTCSHRYTWSGALSPTPPCPKCAADKLAAADPRTQEPAAADVKEALDMAAEIEELAGELPEAGSEFGESVSEKASEIAANIRTHNRCTESQFEALDNMLAGVQRWFGD